MTRCKNLLRIAPVLLLMAAATLASAQMAVAKGSFTLPMEARWGQLALVPGDYTFVVPRDTIAPTALELRHEGRFVGYILPAAHEMNGMQQSSSSLLLQKAGDTYAVKELRIGQVGAFSFRIPKASVSRIAQDSTTIPVRASGK